jgi:putative inorganic carbon (HCO3(-)) transporter
MKNIIKNLKPEYLAELLILLIIGLTPLYFNYFYATSIDLSKIILFKTLLFLLLLVSVWRFAFNKITFNTKLVISAWPLLVFFLGLILSLLFSVDINTSWFGSYDRNEGLSSFLFYGLWFVLLVFNFNNLFKDKAQLARLLLGITVSGFLVSIYAVLQLLGFDVFTWSEPAYLTKRAFASFGQPNYLATWLVMIIPLSSYLFYVTTKLWSKLIIIFVVLVELAALFSTGSRSAFLIFFLVSLCWLIWFLLLEKKYSKKNIFIASSAVLAVFLLFILALFLINPVRVSELKDFKNGSINVRTELWSSGVKAFLKKPFFGYGLENQKEAYIVYYESDWAIYSRPNTYSDRAHNLILDTLITGGLFGLFGLAILLWWVFKNLLQTFQNNQNKFSAFIIWSLAAYLLILMFNFSITVTNIYFFLLIALSFLAGGSFLVESFKKHRISTSLLAILGAIIISFYGSILGIRALEGEYYFQETLSAISEHQYFKTFVLNDYLKETNPNPVLKAYYQQTIALMLIQKLPTVADKSSYYVVDKYLQELGEEINGPDFESQFVKAFIFGVTRNRLKSEEIFTNLSLISPYLPKVYLAWGDVYLFNKNPEKAKLKFEKARSVLPDLNNKYLNNDNKNKLSSYYSLIDSRLEYVNSLINNVK